MDISVQEWGLSFVFENFKRFQGEGVFFLLWGLSLLLLIVCLKKEWKKGIILYIAGLFLTVFNPIFATPVVQILGTDDEYYRLIWLLPITVMVSWMVTFVTEKGKSTVTWLGICIACAVAVAIPGKSILEKGLQPAENIYKISDEVIEIVDFMHTKSGKEDINVLTEFDLTVVLNQYDPTIHLIIPYADVALLREYDQNDCYGKDLPPSLGSQMEMYEVLYNHNELPWMDFGGALNYTEANYLVLSESCPMLDYIVTQSCEMIYETENYYIYEFIPFIWDYENLRPIYE